MDTFLSLSFGTLFMNLFHGIFSARSWQTFASLACGWVLAHQRHTITTYLWLTGATTVKHFSRFSVLLGCPLSKRRGQLWSAVIHLAAQFVPEHTVIRVAFDDTTKKTAGTPMEGRERDRNGAGTARQEYRTLRGFNFVLGLMRVPLKRWSGHFRSVPIGLELSLKEDQAHKLGVPYRSRSQWARDILDFAAQQFPTHPLRSLTDGG